MTDFRALCAELVDIATAHCHPDDDAVGYCAAVLTRARAALSEPEPVGPTDEEIYKLALDGDFLIDVGDGFSCMVQDEVEFARAVLARWGRPAIEPVPEPQGPSELELEAIELKLWDKHRTKGYMGEEFMYDNDFSAALDEYRAALARWGRPAIGPVPGAKGE
jgi:hypothetical protein